MAKLTQRANRNDSVSADEYDADIKTLMDEMDAMKAKFKACLMVLDVTIYCLLPFAKRPGVELIMGQVEAAKAAYQEATGEESMIGFKRDAPMRTARIGLSRGGVMEAVVWPWCEACGAFHLPNIPACKLQEPK
jgi:hypothetical protein